MTHLPMHSGGDVATKVDIAAVKTDIAAVRADIAQLGARMDQMQSNYVVALVGSMTALTAIFSLVVSLLG